MRICSLLPSATEIVCALGLGHQLVAVSHECDYPPEVRSKPHITRGLVDSASSTSAEIDTFVSQHLQNTHGIYALDQTMLEQLDPDLILTQELCDVCAVSYDTVCAAVRLLPGERRILSLEPTGLAGILETITAVAHATGREEQAEQLVAKLQQAIDAIRDSTTGVGLRPRVACLEWIDPPFAGGHWIPELVALAGGEDALAAPGQPSRRLTWQQVLDYQPNAIVLMPCGFDVERTIHEYRYASLPAGWQHLDAVQQGHVYAVDANAYFSRPGPRILHGVEILREILHHAQTGNVPPKPEWRQAYECSI